MEGDEGEHAGVDEQHHEDGAQEPDELALPTPEQARAEIAGFYLCHKVDTCTESDADRMWRRLIEVLEVSVLVDW